MEDHLSYSDNNRIKYYNKNNYTNNKINNNEYKKINNKTIKSSLYHKVTLVYTLVNFVLWSLMVDREYYGFQFRQ